MLRANLEVTCHQLAYLRELHPRSLFKKAMRILFLDRNVQTRFHESGKSAPCAQRFLPANKSVCPRRPPCASVCRSGGAPGYTNESW